MSLRSVDSASPGEEDFSDLVRPLRRELLAHCYRMAGSLHEAEDMVQETYLRAWRAFGGFENRSSLRTWMYRIATNVCLTALESRHRRPLPTGLGQPAADPRAAVTAHPEVTWLEPLPDAVVWAEAATDPADEAVARESVRLAFIAALQHLTPQQRAVLILRDVLAWHADEVAALLECSTGAANSLLQRARASVRRMLPDAELIMVDDPRTIELLERYVEAFETYDIDALVEVLTDDAVWEMPPYDGWYAGAADIITLIKTQCPANQPGDMIMVPTRCNGQRAYALYMRDPLDGMHKAFHVQVPELTAAGVTHVTAFFDTALFTRLGLMAILPSN